MGFSFKAFLHVTGAVALTAMMISFSAPAQAEEMGYTRPKPPPGPDQVQAYEPEGRTPWRGWIVRRGRVFRADEARGNERAAKFAAKHVCERKGGYTCDVTDAIAIPEDEGWVVAAITCRRGAKKGYFLGASSLNYSWDVAVGKARKAGFRPSDCSEIPLKSVN